jgi:hypothetical protein
MAALSGPVKKRRFARWAIPTAAFLLAACDIFGPQEPLPQEPAAVIDDTPALPPVAEPPPPRPAHKPTPPAPAVQAAPVAPVEPTALVDPAHVIGLDQTATIDWLGEPSGRREAPPATIWRYANEDCEIDLYFYLDLQHRVMRALHYEVRSHDIVDQQSQRCFQQFVNEHRQRAGASAAYSPR